MDFKIEQEAGRDSGLFILEESNRVKHDCLWRIYIEAGDKWR